MARNFKKLLPKTGFRLATAVLLAVSVATLIFTACFPTWSDDSKSYVFFSPITGELILRDIEKNKTKVLYKKAEDFGAYAMHPDGKKFARVVLSKKHLKGETKKWISISIRSLTGERKQVLEDFVLGKNKAEDFNAIFMQPAVHWAPDGKTILVQTYSHHHSMALNTETGKTVKFHSMIPALDWDDTWRMDSPITPDSKSFIGNTIRGTDIEYGLYRFQDGKKVYSFDTSSLNRKQKQILKNDPKQTTVVLPAYWKGQKQIRPRNNGLYVFDVEKKTLKFKSDMRMQVLAELAQENKIKIIAELSGNMVLGFDGLEFSQDKPARSMVLYNLKTEKRIEIKELQDTVVAHIVRAPDKKKTLVFALSDKGFYSLVVLGDDGKVIDKVKMKLE